jgi:transcriptional regulator NrdR family protein
MRDRRGTASAVPLFNILKTLCYNEFMQPKEILVVKADGDKEPFDVEKLESSLRRVSASKAHIQQITHHIFSQLEDGMTTHEIYKDAFEMLHNLERGAALRYSLRRAVFELGPSGFPFEQLIAEILKAKGYETLTDQMVHGKCVEHEVDVVAWKDDELIMCEAKYHSQVGMKSDLKVILYVKARFDDLEKATYTYGSEGQHLTQGWLVTNTKFTSSAIKYAECQGMKVIGWNYPTDQNLHSLIEETRLYPITCLHTLSESDKKRLLEKNIVLANSLIEDPLILQSLGFNDTKIEMVTEEVGLLEENLSSV